MAATRESLYERGMVRAPMFLLVVLVACSPSTTDNQSNPDAHVTVDSKGGGGSDAFVFMDAPAGPFGCLGQPVPTTAPDPVALSGTATTLSGTTSVPAPGVKVQALHISDNSAITASVTTDSSGAYSLSLPTGGNALDVYLRASKSGDRDTTVFPATNLFADSTGGEVVIITQSDFDFLAQLSNKSQSSSKGAVGVIVTDCDGTVLQGAVITTQPSVPVVYVNNGTPDTSATSTDATGVGLVFNVPAGSVTLSATVNGMTLRSHTINAIAGVTTTAAIRP